jgi:hypothetical protein
VIAQGDVLTDFSANESNSTEKAMDDPLQSSLSAEPGMSQRYNSMDTVIAPNLQYLSSNTGIPSPTSRTSLLHDPNLSTEQDEADVNDFKQINQQSNH